MADQDHSPARRDLIKAAGDGVGVGVGVGLGAGLEADMGADRPTHKGSPIFARNRHMLWHVTHSFLALPDAAAT